MKRDCLIGPHNYEVTILKKWPSSVIAELNIGKKDATGQFIQLKYRTFKYMNKVDESSELSKEAFLLAGELCGENKFSKQDNSQAVQDFVETLNCRNKREVRRPMRRPMRHDGPRVWSVV